MARRKGRSLGRTEVVAAALACVAEDGPDALNVNRVAARLGIRTPSLYNHVEGADDLRRAVALEVVRELASLSAGAYDDIKAPHDVLYKAAHIARAYALEKPYLYSFLMATPISWEEEPFRTYWPVMMAPLGRVAAELGAPEDQQARVVRFLISSISGFVRLEIRGGFGRGDELASDFDWLIDRLYAGVSAAFVATSPQPA